MIWVGLVVFGLVAVGIGWAKGAALIALCQAQAAADVEREEGR